MSAYLVLGLIIAVSMLKDWVITRDFKSMQSDIEILKIHYLELIMLEKEFMRMEKERTTKDEA